MVLPEEEYSYLDNAKRKSKVAEISEKLHQLPRDQYWDNLLQHYNENVLICRHANEEKFQITDNYWSILDKILQ